MLENFWGIHLDYGDLLLFGENVRFCKMYLNTLILEYKITTVEDICSYCQNHNISIGYKFNKSITLLELREYHKVKKVCKRYHVYASRYKVNGYYLDQKEKQ